MMTKSTDLHRAMILLHSTPFDTQIESPLRLIYNMNLNNTIPKLSNTTYTHVSYNNITEPQSPDIKPTSYHTDCFPRWLLD